MIVHQVFRHGGIFQQIVDAGDQHVFVMAAVEDGDFAAAGQGPRDAPQVIVIQLFGIGHLKGGDGDALGVQSRKDVFNKAVFSRGVHGLQDHDDAPGVFRVKGVLKLGHGI